MSLQLPMLFICMIVLLFISISTLPLYLLSLYLSEKHISLKKTSWLYWRCRTTWRTRPTWRRGRFQPARRHRWTTYAFFLVIPTAQKLAAFKSRKRAVQKTFSAQTHQNSGVKASKMSILLECEISNFGLEWKWDWIRIDCDAPSVFYRERNTSASVTVTGSIVAFCACAAKMAKI